MPRVHLSVRRERRPGMTETDAAPARLAPRDPAAQFPLPDAEGNPVPLSSPRGRRVIVYCYPAALTPGCTTQAVDFTAAAGDLAEAGLDIIRISPQPPEKLRTLPDQEWLDITPVSHPDKAVRTPPRAHRPPKDHR